MERKQSGPRGTDRGVVQGDMQVPFVTSQQSYYNFQNCYTANFRKNDVRKKKKAGGTQQVQDVFLHQGRIIFKAANRRSERVKRMSL